MNERQRLRIALTILGAFIVVGALGYMVIEDLGFVDAVYESVITITTVGYAEPAGGLSQVGRIFTVFLVLGGVGSVFYTAAVALEVFIDELVGGRRRLRQEKKMIEKLSGHTVVCGYGRVGSSVAARLAASNVDLVVVDTDEMLADEARQNGLRAVRGDATGEDVLTEAGLDRAAALVACVHSDSDNLAIVLSARARRPDLKLLARASNHDAERRLKMAGADRIVAPNEVGAERLAALVLNSGLTDFVEIAGRNTLLELRVEEIALESGSELVGMSLADSRIRSKVGTTILAIRHVDGTVTSNPSPTVPLSDNDILVAIGTADQLEQLEKLT
ncbi:MAG: potassium channel protein [Acidimicrobiia bacterium]|nr:potassium channel protein [Acidimicrobiia bacterium]